MTHSARIVRVLVASNFNEKELIDVVFDSFGISIKRGDYVPNTKYYFVMNVETNEIIPNYFIRLGARVHLYQVIDAQSLTRKEPEPVPQKKSWFGIFFGK